MKIIKQFRRTLGWLGAVSCATLLMAGLDALPEQGPHDAPAVRTPSPREGMPAWPSNAAHPFQGGRG